MRIHWEFIKLCSKKASRSNNSNTFFSTARSIARLVFVWLRIGFAYAFVVFTLPVSPLFNEQCSTGSTSTTSSCTILRTLTTYAYWLKEISYHRVECSVIIQSMLKFLYNHIQNGSSFLLVGVCLGNLFIVYAYDMKLLLEMKPKLRIIIATTRFFLLFCVRLRTFSRLSNNAFTQTEYNFHCDKRHNFMMKIVCWKTPKAARPIIFH